MDDEIYEYRTSLVCTTSCHVKVKREWFPTGTLEKEGNDLLDLLCKPLLPLIDDDSIPKRRSQREEQHFLSRADVAEAPRKFASFVNFIFIGMPGIAVIPRDLEILEMHKVYINV